MSEQQDDVIVGLIAAAKAQQATAAAALEALTTERAQLATERAAIVEQLIAEIGARVDAVEQAAVSVHKAAADAVPAIQRAASAAVTRAMAGAAAEAGQAVAQASEPVIARLAMLVRAADGLELRLKTAADKLGRRSAITVSAAAAGGVAVLLLAAWIAAGWQRHQVSELSAQRQALESEIAVMRATAATLKKEGAAIALTKCDDRLCVAVDRDAQTYESEGGDTYMIPAGY